jgi:Acetyltransferase (GNAT) family
MKDAKGHGSNPRGAHAEGVEAALRPVRVKSSVTSNGMGQIDAYVGNTLAGRLILSKEGDDQHNSVFNVEVKPQFRGRGIATQMYQQAEKELGSQLRPSTALSDDGYAFWHHYRPEAVASDLRGIKDKLMGQRVTSSYGSGTINSVGRGAAIAKSDDGYHEWPVPKAEIERLRNAK